MWCRCPLSCILAISSNCLDNKSKILTDYCVCMFCACLSRQFFVSPPVRQYACFGWCEYTADANFLSYHNHFYNFNTTFSQNILSKLCIICLTSSSSNSSLQSAIFKKFERNARKKNTMFIILTTKNKYHEKVPPKTKKNMSGIIKYVPSSALNKAILNVIFDQM